MLLQDKFANTCNGLTSYDNRAELMNITLSYNELLSMEQNERANDANDEINLRSISFRHTQCTVQRSGVLITCMMQYCVRECIVRILRI